MRSANLYLVDGCRAVNFAGTTPAVVKRQWGKGCLARRICCCFVCFAFVVATHDLQRYFNRICCYTMVCAVFYQLHVDIECAACGNIITHTV